MSKISTCVLGLGLMLVGLAVLVAVGTGPDHASARTAQRARIAQVVGDLQGCQLCHTLTAQKPPTADNSIFVAIDSDRSPTAAFSAASTAALKAEINHHLLNLGQRILAVPPSDSVLSKATADEFLRLYEQVQSNGADSSAQGIAWARLAILAELVRLLEHQAQPVQWDQPPDRHPGQAEMVPARLISVAPGIAAAAQTVGLELPSGREMTCEVTAVDVIARMIFRLHRRGPPFTAHREWV